VTGKANPQDLEPVGVVGVELYRRKADGTFFSRKQQRIRGANLGDLYGALAEVEVLRDWLLNLIKETQKSGTGEKG